MEKFVFCIILIYLGVLTNAKRTEEIKKGKYFVSWEINKIAKEITFEVKAETTGFVGFGISKNGGMEGADIVVGGLKPDGTAYFSDRHATENGFPPKDKNQNWILQEASENSTHTYLKFSRVLDTCDPDDVAITGDTVRFIWSLGEDDNLGYHGPRRGAYAVSVLSEAYPEIDLSMYNIFEAVANVTLLPKETTYWSTVHKAPIFSGLQHAVAFGAVLKGELAEKHSHHISLYRCKAPKGKDPQEFFDKYIVQGGVESLDRKPGQQTAYPYCFELIYTWTIGGREMHMPENVGFSIGEREHEYYMMESHFDNPHKQDGLNFESGVRIYYTSDLRPVEAGAMRIGQMYNYNFVIPPASTEYLIVGHCSSNCTKQWIPENGVDIFNVMLHSHAFGKKMKFRQFRNNTELPWITNDDNYDNNYQDNRNIPLVKLLPGDQMAIECKYDNSWLNPPGAVIGGYGTREEMCEVVFYYYPRMDLENCRSNIPFRTVLDFFGIEAVKRVRPSTNPIITAPDSLAGLTLLDYIDSMDWNEDHRSNLETVTRYGEHIEVCGGGGFQKSAISNEVTYITYPIIDQVYEPPERECPASYN